jgi:lipid-binding SYLF domain-containing protein
MKAFKFYLTFVIMLIALSFTSAALANGYSNTISMFKRSKTVQPFFSNAYGYAVFPAIGKGGLVVGGAYGKGKVFQGGRVAGDSSVIKLSVGFQLGGQAFSEIIFFQDKRAYDEFTNGDFTFDAQASAVVITAGAQAQAGEKGVSAGASVVPGDSGVQAKIGYRNGMAVFLHIKGGFMYEAAIGGQKFNFTPGN